MRKIVDDLARALTHEDYVAARARFCRICVASGVDASSVGFFGDTGYPGISDIDAVVIGGADSLRGLISAVDHERRTSASFGYAFWHPPVYCLRETVADAPHLHTLDGLCISDVRLGRVDDNRILYIVWFTFLLSSIANTFGGAGPLSLRYLLLVFKNLEHSLAIFDTPSVKRSTPELREAVLREEVEPDFVYASFIELLERVCIAFDRYCALHLSELKPANRGRMYIGRRLIVEPARETQLDLGGRWRIIRVNGYSFTLGAQFEAKDRTVPFVHEYSSRAARVRSAYRNAGLNYPFVTPFGLTHRSFVRELLIRAFSRIASHTV